MSTKSKNVVYIKEYKYKGIGYVTAVLIPLLVAIGIFVFAVVCIWMNGLEFDDINRSIVQIASGDELIKSLKSNNLLGSEFGAGKRYVLTQDIELSDGNIDELSGLTFYGILDGGGHSVTLERSLTRPLIHALAEDAKLERFEFANFVITPSETDAAIVGYNYGEICDIKVSNAFIKIGNNAATRSCAVATLAAYNLGKINRCVIDANIIIDANFTTDAHANQRAKDWKCIVASVAAVNSDSGEISNVIADVSYPLKFVVLDKKNAALNKTVGLAVGQWIDPANSRFKNIWVIASQEELLADYIVSATDGNLASMSSVWSVRTLSDITYNSLKSEWEDKVENPVWNISRDGTLPKLLEEETSL